MGRVGEVLEIVGVAGGVVGGALRWEGVGRRWPNPWQGSSGRGEGGGRHTRSTRCRTRRTPAHWTPGRRRCSTTGRRMRSPAQECCIGGSQSL